MAKKITTIPATLNRFTATPVAALTKRRVAGYARVSTDLDEQQSSYAAQMDYYRNYITRRNDWEFVGMYSDEGISATNTRHRAGFNRMVDDALAGRIDLIITKSISRFARNTVDSLITVRKLKEKGVEVFFEKENIWTLDSKGELLITIMSSLAQEESRRISENTTWGKRKAFADGKASVAYTHFLGYDRDFAINEEEAQVVRLIYRLFLSGYSVYAITKELKQRGIKTPFGKDKWYTSTVRSILTNEKYKGCALLQKGYTADFLSKKRKINKGEIQQFFIEEHHDAVIPPATFDLVQLEMQKRRDNGHSGLSIFSSKIKCGECGEWYGSKVWHSTDKYRRVVYRCNRKYQGDHRCGTPHLTEDGIKRLFLKALNTLVSEKEEVIVNLELLLSTDTSALLDEKEALKQDVEEMEKTLRRIVTEKAHATQDLSSYDAQYEALYPVYEQKQARKAEIESEIKARNALCEQLRAFIGELMDMSCEQTSFDELLWCGIVDHVTVYSQDRVVFILVGGIEVTVPAG